MLDSVGLLRVRGGMVVGVGGRRREGLGEREGSVLALYVLGMVPRGIDIVCVADRGLPTGCARGVGIWIRGGRVIGATGAISGT